MMPVKRSERALTPVVTHPPPRGIEWTADELADFGEDLFGEDCNEDAMKEYGDSAGCVFSCSFPGTKCDDWNTSTGGLDEPKP